MVSDVEAQQMEQAMVESAGAGLKAQQASLAQAARAAGGGGPFMEQQFQKSQQEVAKQQADAAIKASGQQKLMEAQLQDKRRQLASQEIGEVQAVRDRRADLAIRGTEAAINMTRLLLKAPAEDVQEAQQRNREGSQARQKATQVAEAARQGKTKGEKATTALQTAADVVDAGASAVQAGRSTKTAASAQTEMIEAVEKELQNPDLSEEERADLNSDLAELYAGLYEDEDRAPQSRTAATEIQAYRDRLEQSPNMSPALRAYIESQIEMLQAQGA
jgi:hypothetical protein